MIIKIPPRLASKEGMDKYVQTDLYLWIKSLTSGLNGRLSFDDNFQSFLAENITIEAGATASIPNELPVIPTERIIVRQTGNGVITDGNWNVNTLELVNNGSVSVTISVRFFNIFSTN